MAKRRKKARKKTSRRRRAPTAKAKKAYNKLIVKSYKRLKKVVSKYAPHEL